ncbi:nucleoside triphosphate pyrophosphohydrolase [Actinoplanes ianthinogenes]|uniref:nucleoside triphosphate pyrophosphohydrolase n=1 Tax=Actinoplanes ianthinogenes TaxID=122358 RepID=UPI001670466F|nr:nucleoside triphosphate pyrophosphohydrolase [Actinoplanes ianthinogenes]
MTGESGQAGKLVRDRIPEIIRRDGLEPIVRTATEDEFRGYVQAKLREELAEYLESERAEELADVLEACFAAAALQGVSRSELIELAEQKRQERGGFDDRLIWLGNA